MKNTKLFIALTSAAVLASAALTGCSFSSSAQAVSTEAASSKAVSTEAASSRAASTEAAATKAEDTAAETTGQAASNRLEDILNRGYIEVATEPSFAPNEFIDPGKTGDEQYVGSDIELANYIADALGVELRLQPMDFTSVLGSIATGKYDLAISALAYTPARAETMNLSKGYHFGSEDPQTAYGLLIRESDADKIKTIDDLADKVVVAQNGSIQEQFVQEQIPAYAKYNRVSSTTDGFLMVESERADAMAAALKMAQLYLDSNPDSGLMILPGFYFTVDPETQGTRIGIPKGEEELTEKINEIIDEILAQDLYNQWYEEYQEYAKALGIE